MSGKLEKLKAIATGKKSCERNKPYEKPTDKNGAPSTSNDSSTSSAVDAEFVSGSTDMRSKRLMKEYEQIQRSQKSTTHKPILSAELVDDNLGEWYVRLYVVDEDSPLAKDMTELNVSHILLHLVFPNNYPFAPPFMRVVKPNIERGYVMQGGAICMEILTPRGWASTYSIETLLVQFSASLVKGKARISEKPKYGREYSRQTAEAVFNSLVKTHERYGWNATSKQEG